MAARKVPTAITLVAVALLQVLPSYGAYAAEFAPHQVIVGLDGPTAFLGSEGYGNAFVPLETALTNPLFASELQALGGQTCRQVFPGTSYDNLLVTLDSGAEVVAPDLSQILLVTLADSVDVMAAAESMGDLEGVAFAEPNYALRLCATPQDVLYRQQGNLENGSNIGTLHADVAWDIQRGDPSIRIAIIDTGIEYANKDLGEGFTPGSKVSSGYDYFDNDGDPRDVCYHGTWVAGIAGALTNNLNRGDRIGIAGIAGGWDYVQDTGAGNHGPQLVALRVGNSLNVYSDVVARATHDAADPSNFKASVINLSLAGEVYSETLRRAIAYASTVGAIVVAAKGNGTASNPDVGTTDLEYPADYEHDRVIAVGASTDADARAGYSDFGGGIDLCAPGEAILTTSHWLAANQFTNCTNSLTGIPGGFTRESGTSMSAPEVSGTAALLESEWKAQNGTASLYPEDAQGLMDRTARLPGGVGGYTAQLGWGILDVGRSVQAMRPDWSMVHYSVTGGTAVSGTGGSGYFYYTGDAFWGQRQFIRYDVRATVTLPSGYLEGPYVWGRGTNASTGWQPVSGVDPQRYCDKLGYCNVVSQTQTSAELQTFVYREVYPGGGLSQTYLPTDPSHVVFAYTVLGRTNDITPPGTITNLQAQGPSCANKVDLTWTEPHEDGPYGDAVASYDLRYATFPITEQNFTTATPTSTQPSPGVPGATRTVTLAGLSACTSYYIAIRTIDQAGNHSAISNVVPRTTGCDAVAPARITNLTEDPLWLGVHWTAPGDDGDTGTAMAYDFRWSNQQLTDANFDQAAPVLPAPNAPRAPGEAEVYWFQNDICSYTYFAIRTLDDGCNTSPISNVLLIGPNPCGGACPTVDVLTPSGWQEENTILARSDRLELGQDAYKVKHSALVRQGRVAVRVRENEQEYTKLDRMALVGIDHAEGVRAFATRAGFLVGTMRPERRVTSSRVGDITAIATRADTFYTGAPGETLTVDDAGGGMRPTTDQHIPRIFDDDGKDGTNHAPQQISRDGRKTVLSDAQVLTSSGIIVQTEVSPGTWATVAHTYPRKTVDEAVFDSLGSRYRLIFVGTHRIRHLSYIDNVAAGNPRVFDCVAARHSRLGNVLGYVSSADNVTASIVPGDSVEMAFAVTAPAAGMVRDWFVVARGVYTSDPSMGTNEAAGGSERFEFSLGTARPNPGAGPVAFDFTMAQEGPVSIRVFDVAGRLVRTLVRGSAEAGLHNIVWDASDDRGRRVAAGVYFYRMDAGPWRSEQKVVFLER